MVLVARWYCKVNGVNPLQPYSIPSFSLKCPPHSTVLYLLGFDRTDRKSGGSWDRVYFLSMPLRTQRHTSAPSSAFFKSNQIPCALSSRPLSGECTLSKTQTCHCGSCKALHSLKKAPAHTLTPIICISVFPFARRAVSYHRLSLSLNFSSSVAGPSWKTQSCASGKRPLLGLMVRPLENKGLSFSLRGASDNLRGELVRDQVRGPRVRVAGRPLRVLALYGGGIAGSPKHNWAVSVRQADGRVTDTLNALPTTSDNLTATLSLHHSSW